MNEIAFHPLPKIQGCYHGIGVNNFCLEILIRKIAKPSYLCSVWKQAQQDYLDNLAKNAFMCVGKHHKCYAKAKNIFLMYDNAWVWALAQHSSVHSTEVAFLLIQKLSPGFYSQCSPRMFSWCCWDLMMALFRAGDRGLIRSTEPI